MKKTILIVLLAIIAIHASALTLNRNKAILIDVDIYKNDTVKKNSITIVDGQETMNERQGNYTIAVEDSAGVVLWTKKYYISFEYNGPVSVQGNYEGLTYEKQNLRIAIPYKPNSNSIHIYHDTTLIFTDALPTNNTNTQPIKKQNTTTTKSQEQDTIGLSVEVIILIALIAIACAYLIFYTSKKRQHNTTQSHTDPKTHVTQTLKNAGWSEEDIQKYIHHNQSMPDQKRQEK